MWIDNKPSDYLKSGQSLYDHTNPDTSLLKKIFQCDECQVDIVTSKNPTNIFFYLAPNLLLFYSDSIDDRCILNLIYSYDRVQRIKMKHEYTTNPIDLIFDVQDDGHGNKHVFVNQNFEWLRVIQSSNDFSNCFIVQIDCMKLPETSSTIRALGYIYEVNINTFIDPYNGTTWTNYTWSPFSNTIYFPNSNNSSLGSYISYPSYSDETIITPNGERVYKSLLNPLATQISPKGYQVNNKNYNFVSFKINQQKIKT